MTVQNVGTVRFVSDIKDCISPSPKRNSVSTISSDVIELLQELNRGNKAAEARLIPLVYKELRRIAASYLRRESPQHSLQPTALVHEAYLRLTGIREIDWQSRSHFFAVSATIMRRILVEHVRAQQAHKRGDGWDTVSLNEEILPSPNRAPEILALDEALDRLAKLDERQAKILRDALFRPGMSEEEAGTALGISSRTVNATGVWQRLGCLRSWAGDGAGRLRRSSVNPMDRHRWKTVSDIFHAALEVSSSEREAFVAQVAGGDEELRAEVALLLKADEDAGSYIETPLVPSGVLFPPGAQVSIGDVLCGRFRLMREIGEGGMGFVFEAFDAELGVQLALKVIRPEIAADTEALARFRREVRLARQITHPNVCRTFDLERETRADPDGGHKEIFFLTMEFLDGETLAARIKRDGALPLDEAQFLSDQIAGALEAAHTLGVVHRDIKPGNIMLVPEREARLRAVITDFGLASADNPDLPTSPSGVSSSANLVGTLAYMAPEQLESRTASPATDIYAFGLVLFEMATGKKAFPSDSLLSGIKQRLAGAPPDPATIVPNLPERWRRAIAGCLTVEPEKRFTRADHVAATLNGEDRRETGGRDVAKGACVRSSLAA